jgi:Gti1/Pac2 family transcription factor
VPTFHGFVSNSMDGLVLFEACLSGKLHHVPRRPHDRERAQLIKSGSIFIYEENASGIKRWTDGVAWSPSRILGNFLIYRELEKPFPPGEKKRAMKRKRQSLPGEPYPRRDSDENDATDQITPITPPTPNASNSDVKSEVPSSDQDKDLERSLIGSLVDSYGFRPDGLVKKTMSISVNGISHHMVSYYKVDDVKSNLLPRPLSDPRLQGISVRPELYLKQNFRAPVEETEHYAIDGNLHAHPQMMYPMQGGAYGVRPGQYFGGQQYSPMYAMPASTASPYTTSSGTAWPAQQPSAYGSHPGYSAQGYGSYYKAPSQPVKSDEAATSHSMPYASQYAPNYPTMQRNSSQSTPTMAQSAYQTPVQPSTSTFGSVSARPPYDNSNMGHQAANGPAQSPYAGTSTQPYAVRSPTQGYHMQSAPNSAVAQSPNLASKSDTQSMHSASSANDLAYRNPSYQVGGSSQPGDMNGGLGISGNTGYSQPPPGQGYSGYSTQSQAYRPAGEIPQAHTGTHYAQ